MKAILRSIYNDNNNLGAISARGYFSEGQLSFGITDIHCNGTENNITSCPHNQALLHNCQSHDDAGVVCQGSIILCITSIDLCASLL